MTNYSIEFRRSVEKDLRKIQKQHQIKILQKISDLSNDPRPEGCKKLSGSEKYRIRVGQYRVLYEIRDEVLIITIVAAGHRREVYR